MAVRRLVKRLLTEAVPMAGWSLGRDRRHIPRSTAEPFTPDFHREATQGAPRDDDNIITTRPTLRDLGTVRVHNCAAADAAMVVIGVIVVVAFAGRTLAAHSHRRTVVVSYGASS